MGEAKPFITFVCGFCEHPIKAPATSEGRVGRCPNCRLPVQAPQVSSDAPTFDFTSLRSLRPARLNGMFHGVAVSFALHAVVLSVMALIIVNSRELGRTLITTLFFDTEGTEIEFAETPLETPAVNLGQIEGDPSWGPEGIATDNSAFHSGFEGVRSAGGGSGRKINVTGSIDPLARFSITAQERLDRQPAARQGDYEVALFWDGKSDLDLHICFRTTRDAPISRVINYANRGKPETGFLDVDKNASQPYVNDPIEHIRWNTKSPPSGIYRIEVCAYSVRGTDQRVPFSVEIKTPDGVRSHTGVVEFKQMVEVDTLTIAIEPGQAPEPEAEVPTEPNNQRPQNQQVRPQTKPSRSNTSGLNRKKKNAPQKSVGF